MTEHTFISDDVYSYNKEEKFNVLINYSPSEASEIKFLDQCDEMIKENSWLRENFYFFKSDLNDKRMHRNLHFASAKPKSIIVFKYPSKERFVLDSCDSSLELKEWLNLLFEGKIQKFIARESRHENDIYSQDRKYLKSIVYDTFDEIVMDEKKDVFVTLCYDSTHEAKLITFISELLKDEPNLVIGRMDAGYNDYSYDYFPKSKSFPKLTLFSAFNKSNPLIGDAYIENEFITALQLLQWINEGITHKFDTNKYLKQVTEYDEMESFCNECRKALFRVGSKLNAIRSIIPNFEHSAEEFTIPLKKLLDENGKGHHIDEIIVEEMKSLLEKANSVSVQDVIDLLEEKKKGNVVELKSDETIQSYLEKYEKVIVDFTATWCGPCQAIAPLFGHLSTIEQDIIFLKVDADECANQTELFKVDCFPTFKSFKGKNLIEKVMGNGFDELKKMVEKLH